MRMVKMQQETLTLEEAVQKFLMEKDAQHTGAAAMTDYRNCLARFVKSSHNSIEYDLLDADVLAFLLMLRHFIGVQKQMVILTDILPDLFEP